MSTFEKSGCPSTVWACALHTGQRWSHLCWKKSERESVRNLRIDKYPLILWEGRNPAGIYNEERIISICNAAYSANQC